MNKVCLFTYFFFIVILSPHAEADNYGKTDFLSGAPFEERVLSVFETRPEEDIKKAIFRLKDNGFSGIIIKAITPHYGRGRKTAYELSEPEKRVPVFPLNLRPWKRAGGRASLDGLEVYDLSSPEPLYFERLSAVASMTREAGMKILFILLDENDLRPQGFIDSPFNPKNNVNSEAENKYPLLPPEEFFYRNAFSQYQKALEKLIKGCAEALKGSEIIVVPVNDYSGPPDIYRKIFNRVADEFGSSATVFSGTCSVLAELPRNPEKVFLKWYNFPCLTGKSGFYAPHKPLSVSGPPDMPDPGDLADSVLYNCAEIKTVIYELPDGASVKNAEKEGE
ncbi:MAG: hypothetical protein ACLFQK_07695 [Fibrobacterota bacterium]